MVRIVRPVLERPLDDHHPREAELLAQPHDRWGDDAEVLGDQRQLAELGLGGPEDLSARAGAPAAALRSSVPRRNRPVGDEAAEVVNACQVDELEGTAEALGPPAVVRRPVDAPVVQRIAPVLAGAGEIVGRRACDLAPAEELRVREVLSASLRDVDRDVAEDAHLALAGVVAQRVPLPPEAHLIGERALTGERGPVAGPEGVPRDELLDVGGGHACTRLGKQRG